MSSRERILRLKELFGGAVDIFGEAETVAEAVSGIERAKPDVALLGVRLRDGSWHDVVRRIAGDTAVLLVQAEDEPMSEEDYRQAIRLRIGDVLSWEGSPGEWLSAIHRLLPETGEDRSGRVVAVFSTKGGVGRTTIAANLATELQLRSRRGAAAVDLDLEFGNLAGHLDVRPLATIADLCRRPGPLTLAQVEEALTLEETLGVAVLAAPAQPDEAALVDGEAKREPGRNYVAEVLRLLRLHYSFVVVDTASRFSEGTLTALDEAWKVLLVTEPEVPSLVNTAKALDVLLDQLNYDAAKVLVVVNRMTPDAVDPSAIARVLDHPILLTLPADERAARQAANTGVPLSRRRGRSPLRKRLSQLADVLVREAFGSAGEPVRTEGG